MDLQINFLLQGGKYKIVRFVNSGGFGCTYEAKHVMLHKRVAIKEFFVKDFCNRDEETGHVTIGTKSKTALVNRLKEKFIEEAVALSQMNHPNIVKVTDVFEENGTAYYVMDYIDGHSLDEIVKRRGALSEAEALTYIRQVADALNYVHDQNRLHLDIKPGNIMVNTIGQVILIDFGVSKQYDMVDGENTSTLLGKTPGYAPIEQMGNSVQKFTPATDIYALGATFYKLLSRVTPPESTIIINDGIPDLDVSVSTATVNTINKAMEFRRKDRQQSIKEFLSMLPDMNEFQSPNKFTFKKDEIGNEGIFFNDNFENEETWVDKNMHDNCAVDMGLSVKWSKVNFGAMESWQSGILTGWGDITEKEEEQILDLYPNENPPSCISASEYDIVRKSWGDPWRLPTKEEQDELRRECKFVLTSEKGIQGYKVIAKNGNSIFLPFTGFRHGYIVEEQSKTGYYWSGTLHKANKETAYYLLLTESTCDWRNTRRYFGMAIRPVCNG